MTDNEIIKALECCKIGNCDDCPFYGIKEDCEVELPEEGLALINRQKELINGLIAGQETLQNTIVEQKAEIERLKHRKTELQIRNQELQHEKSEAIKEFAERLTDKADLIKVNPFDSKWAISQDNIDNLVKEMTEVLKNGKR